MGLVKIVMGHMGRIYLFAYRVEQSYVNCIPKRWRGNYVRMDRNLLWRQVDEGGGGMRHL
jgi:hypothetical protein